MTTLDRSLFRAYLQAYLICLISLLSLYVVVDLFMNLEDFAHQGLEAVLRHVLNYYGYKIIQIFDRLSEPIVLLAAMFTVAWVQRNNELLPLLSAGVPTRRVIRPVLVGSVIMLGLGVANQELVIPHVADSLLVDRDDPGGEKVLGVSGAYDTNGVHVEGAEAKRRGLTVKPFYCTVPENLAGGALLHLEAKEARFLPADSPGKHRGGWLMAGVKPASLDPCPECLELVDPGVYFLKTQAIDFDVLTRNRNWFAFASTDRLRRLLDRPDARRLAAIAVLFHQRLTRPVLGLLLVVLGLSVILHDQNRNVYVGTGLCLALCGLFFAAIFACKQLGDNEYLSPALAAWLPVLFFGPLAFSMFDAIHT
jgi:lipopolysaccharide export system permease protein